MGIFSLFSSLSRDFYTPDFEVSKVAVQMLCFDKDKAASLNADERLKKQSYPILSEKIPLAFSCDFKCSVGADILSFFLNLYEFCFVRKISRIVELIFFNRCSTAK
jgi:hypothetical protein